MRTELYPLSYAARSTANRAGKHYLPLHHPTVINLFFAIMVITKDIIIKHHCQPRQFNLDIKEGNSVQEF